MIVTITFNPSLDYFVFLDRPFHEGMIMRAKRIGLRAGGKGVNISLVLAEQGIQSRAVMFLGGRVGQLIEQEISGKAEIEVVKVEISQENRINIKIMDQVETAINALGPQVTQEDQNALLMALQSIRQDDLVVISGSFCPGVGAELVGRISDLVSSAGAKLITDIPNLTEDHYRRIRPHLIKPNLEELGLIFNTHVDLANYRGYVQRLLQDGVANVVLSLGKEGSYFANAKEAYQIWGPPVEVVNTVGCGDAMLANMIASLVRQHDLVETLKYAEAAGRAKAASAGLPQQETIERLARQVVVQPV